MIVIPAELLSEGGAPSPKLLSAILQKWQPEAERLNALKRLYDRDHAISRRARMAGLPNNRLVHDLPGYIVTIASGFLTGKPVTYTPPEGAGGASPFRRLCRPPAAPAWTASFRWMRRCTARAWSCATPTRTPSPAWRRWIPAAALWSTTTRWSTGRYWA